MLRINVTYSNKAQLEVKKNKLHQEEEYRYKKYISYVPALGRGGKKNGGQIEIKPRFKIQYPMKNRDKDALKI